MIEPKIHISRAIWDEDTREVAYIVDGVMTADVGTQRKLNAVDDMYEALEEVCHDCIDEGVMDEDCKNCYIGKALRKARAMGSNWAPDGCRARDVRAAKKTSGGMWRKLELWQLFRV